MTETIEFKVTVTPPYVDTVSGELTEFDKLPYQKGSGDLVIFPQTPEEEQRANKLERTSDFVTFTFAVEQSLLSSLCMQMADTIFRGYSQYRRKGEGDRLLVEGIKAENIIHIDSVSAPELADLIFEITRTI